MQDADAEARRQAACSPAGHGEAIRRCAPSSSSTVSSTGWSTPSAPATRCWPMRRCRCWRRKMRAHRDRSLGSHRGRARMRERRQRPDHCRGCAPTSSTPSSAKRKLSTEATDACGSSSSDLASRAISGRAVAGGDFVGYRRSASIADADFRDRAMSRSTAYDAALVCMPGRAEDRDCSTICSITASMRWSRSRCVADDDAALDAARDDGAPARRGLLHRLQSPLRAAFRAHARPRRIRRARHDLSLPHVLRQRHRAAGAQFATGATRARACCTISARICSTPRGSGSAISARSFRIDLGRSLREPRARPCRLRAPRAAARGSNSR